MTEIPGVTRPLKRTLPPDPKDRKRGILKFLIFLALLCLLLLVPYLMWENEPQKPLDVVVVDKTVAEANFREHRGLMWLLNHHKYVKPQNNADYETKEDYYGFFPDEKKPGPERQFQIKPLPSPISHADLIYIADTYGVYKDDYYGIGIRIGDHSPMIYGGLKPDEAHSIAAAASGGATVVAEFNSFATPTDKGTRESFSQLVGARWSGWAARHFSDLTRLDDPSHPNAGKTAASRNSEVPVWAPPLYEDQYGLPWNFHGPGILWIHEAGTIMVLVDGKDVGPDKVTFTLTDPGGRQFGVKPKKQQYNYWFDVVQARPGSTTLAMYHLDLTQDGRKKMAEKGIPTDFPAVIRMLRPSNDAYYFAGDYVDSDEVPKMYKLYGWDELKKYLTVESEDGQTDFFWNSYTPMMKWILRDAERRRRSGGAGGSGGTGQV